MHPKQVARCGETDDDDIAGVRDIVAEQQPHDSDLDVLRRRAVLRRVAPRPRHLVGEEDQPRIVRLENAASDEAHERPCADVIPPRGDALDPVRDGMRAGLLGELREDGIEQVVSDRCRIQDHQLPEVRIDTVLQCQIHQRRSGENHVQSVRRQGGRDIAALVVQDQKENFFSDSQHGTTRLHPICRVSLRVGRKVMAMSGIRSPSGRTEWGPWAAQAVG